MPEPTSTTVGLVTLGASGTAVPMLVAFGIPLGLRVDVLVAGFTGSLVAIILLNTVPTMGDTWRELGRTTLRRMFVALASSFTAGYLTPMALLAANLSDPMTLFVAFVVGAGAQKVLAAFIERISTAAGTGPQARGAQ